MDNSRATIVENYCYFRQELYSWTPLESEAASPFSSSSNHGKRCVAPFVAQYLGCLCPPPSSVHGSLARAGKVKSQTPKVEPQEKKKVPKGRAKKKLLYNRRCVPLLTITSVGLISELQIRQYHYPAAGRKTTNVSFNLRILTCFRAFPPSAVKR